MTWREIACDLLRELGGHAYLRDMYQLYGEKNYGRTAVDFGASLRDALEKGCPESEKYDGRGPVFYMVDGKKKGHWGLTGYEGQTVELTADDDSYAEGKRLLREHVRRERNQQLVTLAKERFLQRHGRLFCEICGFCFSDVYGELGDGFIEAHHIKPVSQLQEGEKPGWRTL